MRRAEDSSLYKTLPVNMRRWKHEEAKKYIKGVDIREGHTFLSQRKKRRKEEKVGGERGKKEGGRKQKTEEMRVGGKRGKSENKSLLQSLRTPSLTLQSSVGGFPSDT